VVSVLCVWECVEECVKRRLPFHDIFLEETVREKCVEECRKALEKEEVGT